MAEVTLCECFARDGLRHEPDFVPTATKRARIERFAALGFARIEATSYSSPKVYGGGHTGNVCTEDPVSLFEAMGIAAGIDLDRLVDTARFCEQALGRELHARVTRLVG